MKIPLPSLLSTTFIPFTSPQSLSNFDPIQISSLSDKNPQKSHQINPLPLHCSSNSDTIFININFNSSNSNNYKYDEKYQFDNSVLFSQTKTPQDSRESQSQSKSSLTSHKILYIAWQKFDISSNSDLNLYEIEKLSSNDYPSPFPGKLAIEEKLNKDVALGAKYFYSKYWLVVGNLDFLTKKWLF